MPATTLSCNWHNQQVFGQIFKFTGTLVNLSCFEYAMKYNARTLARPPAMHAANFCVECGERLARKGWRAPFHGNFCDQCAQRLGTLATRRWLLTIPLIAVLAFVIGMYMRPSPPPLIIQRGANSPLSDLPVNPNDNPRAMKQANGSNPNGNVSVATADDAVYICGARTQKGTPCRRRVHAAGERCFQHKGMPSLVPLSKLVIRP